MPSQNYIGWTPVKLARTDGEWSLEVQRLIALSKTLYRPQHGRIHGREPILEELRDREGLAKDAEAVFSRVTQDGVFELRGGRFRAVDPDEKPLEVMTYDAELEARVKSLEGELKRMQARLSNLGNQAIHAPSPSSSGSPHSEPSAASPASPAQAGTAEVAAQAAPAQTAADEDASPAAAIPQEKAKEASAPPSENESPAPAKASEPDSDAPADGEAQASTPATEDSETSEPASASAEENAAAEAADAEAPDAEAPPPMKLPTLEEFSSVFDELLGGEITLSLPEGEVKKKGKRKKATPEKPGALTLDPSTYVTSLITDEDKVVGAMACSVEAVIHEGGSLLMLGPEAIENMLQSEPTEEAMEATQEILNVSSRCFNEVSGNPHIRVTTLGQLNASEDHTWVPKARDWIEFVDSKGGRIWLIAK